MQQFQPEIHSKEHVLGARWPAVVANIDCQPDRSGFPRRQTLGRPVRDYLECVNRGRKSHPKYERHIVRAEVLDYIIRKGKGW